MSATNGLPSHLYAQSAYRATPNTDFPNEKVSPMHYISNAYAGHQATTAVDLYTDLYNGYNNGTCTQNTDFGELSTMDMPSIYNVNGYGYETAQKFGGEHAVYYENEKKFDVNGVDGSGSSSANVGGRNLCIQNGYMHYNNCWLSSI